MKLIWKQFVVYFVVTVQRQLMEDWTTKRIPMRVRTFGLGRLYGFHYNTSSYKYKRCGLKTIQWGRRGRGSDVRYSNIQRNQRGVISVHKHVFKRCCSAYLWNLRSIHRNHRSVRRTPATCCKQFHAAILWYNIYEKLDKRVRIEAF